MSLDSTLSASIHSKLPDPSGAGFADKLYRLDGGRSLANDESVWTPGENVGRSIQFSSTCWLIQRANHWLLWDTGVPESALNDPKGWSTLPKLIVYHLDKTLTDQLAMIGTQDDRHHLCGGVPYPRRPHWQCSLVRGLNGPDPAGRVYMDQFSRWPERQRKSTESSCTQSVGYSRTSQVARWRYGRVWRRQHYLSFHTGTYSGEPIIDGASKEIGFHHSVWRRGSPGREF